MKIPCSLFTCFSAGSLKEQNEHEEEGGGSGDDDGSGFRVFSHSELKSATRGFNSSDKVGQGGFGIVYKGRLRNGNIVAVKVVSIEVESMRGESEFVSELATLSHIKHQNLVGLRGCCVEGAHRYLVYDYMKNNSLHHTFLGGEQSRMRFRWELRRDISIGVARGLAYLHHQLNPHIVHRDIKPTNILLDHNLTPKLSDFGFAKLLRDEKSYVSTKVAGTLGYLAPEYATSGQLTRKSDVYSFGVLLLEIVSGQVAVGAFEDTDRFLVEKVWAACRSENLIKMVDPVLKMEFEEEEAIRFLRVGLLCVQETARLRPRMTEAVEMLCNKIEMGGIEISKPGFVADLRNIKMRHQLPLIQDSSSSSSGAHYGTSFWSSANLGR